MIKIQTEEKNTQKWAENDWRQAMEWTKKQNTTENGETDCRIFLQSVSCFFLIFFAREDSVKGSQGIMVSLTVGWGNTVVSIWVRVSPALIQAVNVPIISPAWGHKS